jgi:pilus assembly protein CpaB
MSKARVAMFGLAIGSAVLAVFLYKGVLGKKKPAEAQQTQIIDKVKKIDVLVAARDVTVGEKLAAGSLIWKNWPEDSITEPMITKDEMPEAEMELAEARAAIQMFEGEVVIAKKYIKTGEGGFLSAVLPKGMRAVSVAVSPRSTAGGFILPNDRVDVLLTKKISGEGQLVKSETVISNVRILAMNQIFKKTQEGEDVALKEVETATLELTAQQTEVLAKVETEGELSLALRSIAENDGRPLNEGPQLAEKYRGDGKIKSTDTLIIRAGIETYATSR